MTEPLFFDCLTDAQFWSLFDTGVLQDYLLPMEVYQRLERLAPDHSCYLFTWPEGSGVPSLPDMVAAGVVPSPMPAAPDLHPAVENFPTAEGRRTGIAAWCERRPIDPPPQGGRIYAIVIRPRLELRVGPCLEPRPRDLTAMSLAELEAYLDAVLHIEENTAMEAAHRPPGREGWEALPSPERRREAAWP